MCIIQKGIGHIASIFECDQNIAFGRYYDPNIAFNRYHDPNVRRISRF